MRGEWQPDPSSAAWAEIFRKAEEHRLEKMGAVRVSPGGPIGLDREALVWAEQGTDDPFEQAVDGILAELRELMLRKHRDYGPLNIALAPGGAINGLRVRMHDKLARINNLTDKQAEPENESLQDSFLDGANYNIIGLMVLRGLWPGTEGK